MKNICRIAIAGLFALIAMTPSAWAVTTTLNAAKDANITGSGVDTVPPATYGLVVNVFDPSEAVLDFNASSIPSYATISSAQLTFEEVSYANAQGVVSILGGTRTGNITASDATSLSSAFGSYNSISLGLGLHTISLDSKAVSSIQSILGTTKDLGLLFTSGSSDTNTAIGAIEQSPGFTSPTLAVTYAVPEPASVGLLGLFGLLLRRPGARRA